MGITTRGGVARILEYNINDGLISEIESSKRIIFILQICAFIFSIILQFIVLLIFGTIYDGTKTFLLVDDRLTPNLNYYVQSISLNGSVRHLPILQTTNSSIRWRDFIDVFSFPNSEIQFAYQYRDDLVFLYSSFKETHSFSVVYTAINEKYTTKKSFREDDSGLQYKLPKNSSLVEIGSYIWLYGMYLMEFSKYIFQKH